MVESFKLWCEPAGENRIVNVYLPNDYHESDERYPVVYMFDGHNLFYDHEAAYGKSWGIREFLDSWDKKVIVVGVYCSMHGNDRLVEYSPYNYFTKFTGSVKGTGKTTMDWYTGFLKEYIDSNYRTWWHREATAIAGSSMGGIMAYYAVMKYNHIYSKAAVISPAFRMVSRSAKAEPKRCLPLLPDTRIFFSWGELEDKRGVLERIIVNVNERIQSPEISTYLYKHMGGTHSEGSWEQEVPMWMDYLWKD